jgi:hypothetical protein
VKLGKECQGAQVSCRYRATTLERMAASTDEIVARLTPLHSNDHAPTCKLTAAATFATHNTPTHLTAKVNRVCRRQLPVATKCCPLTIVIDMLTVLGRRITTLDVNTRLWKLRNLCKTAVELPPRSHYYRVTPKESGEYTSRSLPLTGIHSRTIPKRTPLNCRVALYNQQWYYGIQAYGSTHQVSNSP